MVRVALDLLGGDRAPESVVEGALLALARPVGLLMIGVLARLSDLEDPARVVARYRAALAPGSALAVSHLTIDCRPAAATALAAVVRGSGGALHPRPATAIAALFEGFDVVPPGVVGAASWRPDAVGDTTAGTAGDQVLVGLGVLA